MMINGVHMATDGSEMNDTLTKQAIDYMESQIRDPLLQDILRPYSKCKLFSLVNLDNLRAGLTGRRFVQTPPPS